MTFDSPLEQAITERVALENPRRKGESWIAYSERLAIIAGFMKPENAAFDHTDANAEQSNLIDREPGDDG